MTDTEAMREAFEAWAAEPPFELDLTRLSDDPRESSWPGQYQRGDVQLAWEAWQAAALATPSPAVDAPSMSESREERLRRLRRLPPLFRGGLLMLPLRPRPLMAPMPFPCMWLWLWLL